MVDGAGVRRPLKDVWRTGSYRRPLAHRVALRAAAIMVTGTSPVRSLFSSIDTCAAVNLRRHLRVWLESEICQQLFHGVRKRPVAEVRVVAGRDPCVCVTEQLRNCKEVSSGLCKERRVGMTQLVERNRRHYLRNLAGLGERTNGMIPAPRGCVGLDEDEIITDPSSDHFSEKGTTLGGKWDMARSAGLSVAFSLTAATRGEITIKDCRARDLPDRRSVHFPSRDFGDVPDPLVPPAGRHPVHGPIFAPARHWPKRSMSLSFGSYRNPVRQSGPIGREGQSKARLPRSPPSQAAGSGRPFSFQLTQSKESRDTHRERPRIANPAPVRPLI
jgi:hypothetical protein